MFLSSLYLYLCLDRVVTIIIFIIIIIFILLISHQNFVFHPRTVPVSGRNLTLCRILDYLVSFSNYRQIIMCKKLFFYIQICQNTNLISIICHVLFIPTIVTSLYWRWILHERATIIHATHRFSGLSAISPRDLVIGRPSNWKNRADQLSWIFRRKCEIRQKREYFA